MGERGRGGHQAKGGFTPWGSLLGRRDVEPIKFVFLLAQYHANFGGLNFKLKKKYAVFLFLKVDLFNMAISDRKNSYLISNHINFAIFL